MPKQSSAYKALMSKDGQMDTLISTFMNLATCPVWLHERHIYTAIDAPQGQMFGQFHTLSCIIGVIQNGYGGNKKTDSKTYYCVDKKYTHCSFSEYDNTHGICYQEYGSAELFHGGTSAGRSVSRRPRWFCLGGRPVCTLQIQTEIVAEAMGDDSIEMDDTTRNRRKGGFMSFFFEDTVDGGYSSIDITQIARNNYQLLPSIFSKSATAIRDAGSERIERRLQSSQRQQQQPQPRKSKNRQRRDDNSDGFEGLPSFLQKRNLCECVYYL